MKMFRMLAASMLSAALCLGFTACSDDDENENGEGGGSTVTVVKPSEVFKGGLPKSAAGMSISQNKEGLVTSIIGEDGEKPSLSISLPKRRQMRRKTAQKSP